MIGSVSSSSYSTYTSINRTATNSARDQQFQRNCSASSTAMATVASPPAN
ncbi:hypothetical protein QZH47_30340 [Pseudomonas corrugata]